MLLINAVRIKIKSDEQKAKIKSLINAQPVA
jgi:hypothetical protein